MSLEINTDEFWKAQEAKIAELRAALQRPDRAELQAEGKHPAPCAKFCEATAFGIDERRMKAEIAKLKTQIQEQALQTISDINQVLEATEDRDKYKALCDQLGAAMTEARSNLWSMTDEAIVYRMDTALTAWRAMK